MYDRSSTSRTGMSLVPLERSPCVPVCVASGEWRRDSRAFNELRVSRLVRAPATTTSPITNPQDGAQQGSQKGAEEQREEGCDRKAGRLSAASWTARSRIFCYRLRCPGHGCTDEAGARIGRGADRREIITDGDAARFFGNSVRGGVAVGT